MTLQTNVIQMGHKAFKDSVIAELGERHYDDLPYPKQEQQFDGKRYRVRGVEIGNRIVYLEELPKKATR